MLSRKSKVNETLFKGQDSSVISKKSAFREVSTTVSKIMKIDLRIVIESLANREIISNTALVQGIAIPHIILPKSFSPWLFIFRSSKNISDWKCLDDSKVRVLICLVVPQELSQKDKNFKEVRRIINKLAEDDVVSRISKAETAKQVIDILRR